MDPGTLEFGPFKLERNPGHLTRGDGAIPLRPKAAAVLGYLVSRRGRLVTKNELHEQIWGTAHVSDTQLRVIVREIRAALGDDANSPHYLETVPGRGYRFRDGHDASSGPEADAGPHVAAHDQFRQIVGRQHELEYLLNRYLRAAKGQRQLVFVGGEPGIGKTTLVQEFLQRLEQRPRTIGVVGQCTKSFGAGEAYGPVLEAFGRLGRQTGGGELSAVLTRYAPMWLVQLPALVEPNVLERLQRQVQGATRERMVREVNDALEKLTSRTTLLLVLEDVHWSDVATMELLASIAQRSEAARLMILATFRPAEMAVRATALREMLNELSAKGLSERLDLEHLNERDVETYVGERLTGQVSPEVASMVFRSSGGNALFMVNVLEHLMKVGAVYRQDDRWMLDDAAGAQSAIPEGLRPFLKGRLDDLSTVERQTLEVASIVGIDFVAAAVAGGLDGSQEWERVEACLEFLASVGPIIATDGVADWPDGTLSSRYRFCHSLYREEIYQGIPEARRIRLHKRVGDVLRSAYGPSASELAPILAEHFDQGRDLVQAARFWKLSGELALDRHAYHEAAEHLRRALNSFEKGVPADRSRHARSDIDELDDGFKRELEVCTALGNTLIATRGYSDPELRRIHNQAAALCEQLTKPIQRLPTLYNLWNFHLVAGELKKCSDLKLKISKLVAQSNDEAHHLIASNVKVQNDFLCGDVVSSGNEIRKAMSRYDPERHGDLARRYGQEDPGVMCLVFDAWRLWLTGSPDKAVVRVDEAVALAERLDQPYCVALAKVFAIMLHQFRGDVVSVHRDAEILETVAGAHGFQLFVTICEIMQGWALVETERTVAIARMEQGLEAFRSTGARLFIPYFNGLIAESYLSLGHEDAARRYLTEALAQVESSDERWWEAELHRLEGEVLIAAGDGAAEECFRRSLEIAQRQGARSLALRVAYSLSGLPGESREALQQLGELVAGFTEGFDTADLRLTRARLADGS